MWPAYLYVETVISAKPFVRGHSLTVDYKRKIVLYLDIMKAYVAARPANKGHTFDE